MKCFSSDRSQLRNVSIFGRLTQRFPPVVAFRHRYVLRFKLTARATCRGANKDKINPTDINQRRLRGPGDSSATAWSLDSCILSVCDSLVKVDHFKCRIRGYLSVHDCMFSVQNRLPRGRHEYVPDLHFGQLRVPSRFRLDSLSCST